MSKQEFLKKLEQELELELPLKKVKEHIRYYNEFIDGEVRTGKSEEEVLEELGDPRLIAKNIISVSLENDLQYDDFHQSTNDQNTNKKTHQTVLETFKLFIIVFIIIAAVVLLILGVIYIIIPIAIIAAIVFGIMSLFGKKME